MRYEYTCPLGHVTERKGGVGDTHAPCSACNRPARRREFNLAAVVGATVMKEQKYRVSEFMEASQEIAYHHAKTETTAPDLWGIAKKEARRRGAKVGM